MPTHYHGKANEIMALDTYIKFTRASSSLDSRLLSRDILGDLTHSQFGVLETLYHLGPLCQGTLSQKLLKSTGNITLVLDNLEKRGLVRRIRSPEDRRMVIIELTPAGRALIAELFPRMAAAITQEMSVLTPGEQMLLGELCKKLGRTPESAPAGEAAGSEADWPVVE